MMVGLGFQMVGSGFKNMAIFGINSLDFWGVNPFFDGQISRMIGHPRGPPECPNNPHSSSPGWNLMNQSSKMKQKVQFHITYIFKIPPFETKSTLARPIIFSSYAAISNNDTS